MIQNIQSELKYLNELRHCFPSMLLISVSFLLHYILSVLKHQASPRTPYSCLILLCDWSTDWSPAIVKRAETHETIMITLTHDGGLGSVGSVRDGAGSEGADPHNPDKVLLFNMKISCSPEAFVPPPWCLAFWCPAAQPVSVCRRISTLVGCFPVAVWWC